MRTPVEFGHKVFLVESAEGLITQYEVLKGNPPDELHVASFPPAPQASLWPCPAAVWLGSWLLQRAEPCLVQARGVKVVCIPQRGGKRTGRREAYEKSAVFKNGQRFRAGIEGRISVLFRGRGMKRCLAEGRDRFELWVGAAVLANNLMRIAAMQLVRSPRSQKVA